MSTRNDEAQLIQLHKLIAGRSASFKEAGDVLTVAVLELARSALTRVVEERDDWRAAAIQAKDDLRGIEQEFAEGRPPIGPGHVFAEWTSPANTMRWIERMEARAAPETAGER